MESATAPANPYSLSALKQNGAIKAPLLSVKNYHHHTSSMPANLNQLPNTVQLSESHVYPPPPQPPLVKVNAPTPQSVVNATTNLNSSWSVAPASNGTNGYLSAEPPTITNFTKSTGNLQSLNGYYANSNNGISTATGPLPPPPVISNGSAPNLNSSDNSSIIGKALSTKLRIIYD